MKSMLGEMQFNCFSYYHFYIAVNYFLEMFLLLVYLKKNVDFFLLQATAMAVYWGIPMPLCGADTSITFAIRIT